MNITLECTECKKRNYITTRNNKGSKISIKKYCNNCNKHATHKETK